MAFGIPDAFRPAGAASGQGVSPIDNSRRSVVTTRERHRRIDVGRGLPPGARHKECRKPEDPGCPERGD